MSRARKRADRLRTDISIIQLLSDYGYHINPHGGDREQQYSCDLHGSGRDNTPSARAYPNTNKTYCFGCSRIRDPIQICREKEGLDFWGAVRVLEKRYNLPELPWEEDEPVVQTLSEQVRHILDSGLSKEEIQKKAERRLELLTADRDLSMDRILELWETFDKTVYHMNNAVLSEREGNSMLLNLIEQTNAFLS